MTGRDLGLQLLVRRRDQPHIQQADDAQTSDALELLLLQTTQQLDLRFLRHLADCWTVISERATATPKSPAASP